MHKYADTYIHMQIHAYTCRYLHTRAYTYTSRYIHKHADTCLNMQIHTYTCIYTCRFMHKYADAGGDTVLPRLFPVPRRLFPVRPGDSRFMLEAITVTLPWLTGYNRGSTGTNRSSTGINWWNVATPGLCRHSSGLYRRQTGTLP